MTSSTKKKRERKKDFQKPKLKVGQAKPKPTNQTDTSFRAKGIVLNQQLNTEAPTATAQYHHHLSLLGSRSDAQRRDSLAFLTAFYGGLAQIRAAPLPTGTVLDRLCPLVLDANTNVRAQLLKLLQALPRSAVQDYVHKLLPHIRAGMTHLSHDIRNSAIDCLSWLIGTAGSDLVSCRGGWYQTLLCFTTMLAWTSSDVSKWTASMPSSNGGNRSTAKIITVLSEFLEAGLLHDVPGLKTASSADDFPFWHAAHHRIPAKSNAYAYLNLFGPPQDLQEQMLEDCEDRFTLYNDHFRALIDAGIVLARKEGGDTGRATGLLSKILERAKLDEYD